MCSVGLCSLTFVISTAITCCAVPSNLNWNWIAKEYYSKLWCQKEIATTQKHVFLATRTCVYVLNFSCCTLIRKTSTITWPSVQFRLYAFWISFAIDLVSQSLFIDLVNFCSQAAIWLLWMQIYDMFFTNQMRTMHYIILMIQHCLKFEKLLCEFRY